MKIKHLLTLFCIFIFNLPFLFAQNTSPIMLTLDDAIEIALEKSYNMKILKLSVLRAREDLTAAKGRFRTRALMDFDVPNFSERLMGIQQGYGFTVYNSMGIYRYQGNLSIIQPLPTNGELSVSSSLYHLRESFLTLANTDTTTRRFQTSLSLNFTQPLFTINNLKYGLKRAQLNYDRANRLFSSRELDIIYEVTGEFYNLYQATRQREIAQDQVSKTQQTYELAQKKYDAGLIPEVEALQMEVDFADSKNNLFVAATRIKQQSDYFKQLIGLSLDENVLVRTDFAYQTFAIDSTKALEEAMKNRSEIREREIELELSQMSVNEVDSRWQIRGDLSAFYDLSGISATDLIEDDFRSLFNSSITDLKNRPRNKGVVFKLTVPLWDWGVNRAEVAAAKASVETAQYSLTELKKTITREIRSAIDRVKQSENRLDVLKRSEDVAQKSYQISVHRFDNGDITSQELALDQQRLTNARTAYLDAFIAYQLAVADLKRKTMFDFEKGRSLVE